MDVTLVPRGWRSLAVGGALAVASAAAGCTPDIATDPQPAVMQFDPTATPARVSEPSFVVKDPTTGLINLALGGITVPPDCANQTALPQAQCEFDQYLQTLDGFPTVSSARTPVSAAVDLTTATVPTNVAVVDGAHALPFNDARISFDIANNYLGVAPAKSWPVGGFVWMGVRGYDAGIRAGGQPVVASVPYDLLKRDDSLTCGGADAATIPLTCPYYQLFLQQMPDAAARAQLVQLEQLRQAMNGLGGWALIAGQGIPKAQAAIVWGFPIHSGSVIDLDPTVGLAPAAVAPDEVHLAVNGSVDATTVKAFEAAVAPGDVYFMNLKALAAMDLGTAFPKVTATYANGAIVIKGMAAFPPSQYGVIVTRAVKNATGQPLVLPPVSMLLMAHGALVDAAGKSTVSSVPDIQAAMLEAGRQQLAPLLSDTTFASLTGIKREEIAYVYAFDLGTP